MRNAITLPLDKPDSFFEYARQAKRLAPWVGRHMRLMRRRIYPTSLQSPNVRRLALLHKRHQGERAFIIGNGPSLQIDDLDRLKNEITFGSNKIYLAFDRTAWRPTYYHVADILVAKNNARSINQLPLTRFYADCCLPWLDVGHDVYVLNEYPRPLYDLRCRRIRFSRNPLRGIHGGATVIYHQLQMAYFMGIREVILLGMDFRFRLSPPTGQISPQGPILCGRGENNHFDPEYRKPGETWTFPDMARQKQAMVMARGIFEMEGRRIINASRKTDLTALRRADLDSILVGCS